MAQDTRNYDIGDSHLQDRVLTRLSTIDWWITNSTSPNEKLKRLTDILFSSLDKEVERYYGANWERAMIKWGPPMLQQNLVRTNIPLVDLPSHLRIAALKKIFFPDYTLPNYSLPPATVRDLRSKIGVALDDNILLNKQIRL